MDSQSIQAGTKLSAANLIFWDFDGVIKDSVDVKSEAYKTLFLPFGKNIAMKIRKHHDANGGVSRFDKIPLYLDWVGESGGNAQIEEFCNRFSRLVQQSVIDSPWVPGVQEYLLNNYEKQDFVLVTATPQEEIARILSTINIGHCFREVYGAPKSKAQAIKEVLIKFKYAPSQALMIGDSESDFEAAQANFVPFLLRCTPLNLSLQAIYTGPMFEGLNHE